MSKSLFVFISGTSGAGKNTIINNVIKRQPEYKFLLSHTTRDMRVDDIKKNYHHIEKSNFESLLACGDIIEYDIFNDNYYGISKNEIKQHASQNEVVFKDISVKCVLNANEIFKNTINFTSIFLTERKKVLKQRLLERKYSPRETRLRLKLYKHEQSKIKFYDYVIVNTHIEKTTEFVEAIVNFEKNNLPINTFESCQNVLEKTIDNNLKRIEKNKPCKEILVTVFENQLYIVSGINSYLAYLKAGKRVVKKFVDYNNFVKLDEEQEKEWKKLLKLYS